MGLSAWGVKLMPSEDVASPMSELAWLAVVLPR